MRKFIPSEIINTFSKKGYPLSDIIGTVNIFGIRNNDVNADTFDDCVGILYKINNTIWILKQYSATTDPGEYYRLNPMNSDGTAIIVPGFYKEVYKVGKHNGYEAMQQIAPIAYVRDNNKNKVLDLLYKTTGFKVFKQLGMTNIHHAGENSLKVWNWSAGCQVIAKLLDFLEFMKIIKSSDTYRNTNRFDYALFEIEDFTPVNAST